jgi:hypothetical protein
VPAALPHTWLAVSPSWSHHHCSFVTPG